MTQDAKAASAGSTSGRGSRLDSTRRGALGVRASSPGADGSGAPSRRYRTSLALGLLVVALIAMALAPPAMASVLTRARTATFGSDGTAGSSLSLGGALAFNQANERLYAIDGGYLSPTVSIDGFAALTHTPLGGSFPIAIGPSLNAITPAGLAVDNTASPSLSAGNIYYAHTDYGKNPSGKMLYGFSSSGATLGGNFPVALPSSTGLAGIAVDPFGNLYVSDPLAGLIRKYDSAGNPIGTIDTSAQGSPIALTFDSNGDLFFGVSLLNGGKVGVYRYTAASGYNPTSVTKFPWSSEFSNLSPRAIAVDATSHTLYVADTNKVSAFSTLSGAFLYDFATNLRTAVGAGGNAFAGVTVDQATDTVYVSDAANGTNKIYVFGPAQVYADATATPTAATGVTDTTAQIGATIDDNNALPTLWRLEFSSDNGSTWTTVKSGRTDGGQTGVAVSATATGLDPNTDYKFRIVTNKGTGAVTEVASYPLGFHTVAPPPVISNVGAVGVTDTSARVVATIDPRNAATGYVVEYGLTPALGSSTAPVGIGSGTTPLIVSQVIGNLKPDTTYYYRLAATNLTGTTKSASKTLRTRANPLPLPDDDRAYEMVTPPDKNQGGVDSQAAGNLTVAGFARDGNAAGFCTSALFGDPPAQMSGVCAPYLSRRGPGGWTTSNPFPAYCNSDPGFSGTLSGTADLKAYPSPNLDRAVLLVPESAACPIPPLDSAAPLPAKNLYLADYSTDPPSYHLLAPHPNDGVQAIDQPTGFLSGASDDFSHIVYSSFGNQTPDSPPQAHFKKLYDWHDGALDLVSKDVGNAPFTTSSDAPGDEYRGPFVDSSVSDNGDRIYFQNATTDNAAPGSGCSTAACHLYMRENGATTYKVSASECSVACGAGSSPDRFLWATPSGDKALFISCSKLTDDSASSVACVDGGTNLIGGGAKIYRWDRNGAPGHLIDISTDHEPADGTQADAQDVIGASTDGNVVYFVANGQIVSGAPTNTSGNLKLYRWSWNDGSPTVDYLGPYSDHFNGLYYNFNPDQYKTHSKVTPDGKYLVILTRLALDPVADQDSDSDVYRWDQADGWTCLSCQLPGTPSAGEVDSTQIGWARGALGTPSGYEPVALISDDGQRVFFDTPDALVPQDVNGAAGCTPLEGGLTGGVVGYSCQDVYEWHDGTLSLISSGTGERSVLIGATRSGSDVFFETRNRLVGWDTDNGTDIYDARTGGGFPEPSATGAPCDLNAGACEGTGTSAPPAAGAGSAVFQGPGNPPIKHPKPRKHHRHKRHHKRHHRAANHKRRAPR